MERIRCTPSQTVGPFFAYGLTAEQYGYDYTSVANNALVSDSAEGERIFIVGAVFDGGGKLVSDAMIELWQADARGQYPSGTQNRHGFKGFGRLGTGTNDECKFRFTTIKPGSSGEGEAPHINVILFMRGSLHQLYTRLYFSDESEANSKDAMLARVPEERRHTLIAEQRRKPGTVEYHFDIHMQGDNETIFFEI